MTTPEWFTQEEMGGWDVEPPNGTSRRTLKIVASLASSVVLAGVGYLIYVNISQSTPTDIRNVISAQGAEALAAQTLGGPQARSRYRLERITLSKNHLVWLTSWRSRDGGPRRCVVVGQALHLGNYAGRIILGAGPQTPVAAVVPCQSLKDKFR